MAAKNQTVTGILLLLALLNSISASMIIQKGIQNKNWVIARGCAIKDCPSTSKQPQPVTKAKSQGVRVFRPERSATKMVAIIKEKPTKPERRIWQK